MIHIWYTHVNIITYIHTNIHVYIHTSYIHIHIHTYIYTYKHTYIYTYIHTYMRTYIPVNICILYLPKNVIRNLSLLVGDWKYIIVSANCCVFIYIVTRIIHMFIYSKTHTISKCNTVRGVNGAPFRSRLKCWMDNNSDPKYSIYTS